MDSLASHDQDDQGGGAADMERIRAEMEAAYQAARDRVAARLPGRHTEMLAQGRGRAREMTQTVRAKARKRICDVSGEWAGNYSPPTVPRIDLPLHDLHTLERLCSYVRHSIVRVCFYNLKLFCPSLIDEYDTHVKEQVLANIDQLDAARAEIALFFDQRLSDGRAIGDVFGTARTAALDPLDALICLAATTSPHLDDEPVRRDFAQRGPSLIDAVMDGLHSVQADLEQRKIRIREATEQAVGLASAMMEQAGLDAHFEAESTPTIFGNKQHLVDAFVELMANAAKYSKGTQLEVLVEPLNSGRQMVQVSFTDNGQGMTEEELATCLQRGASKGGTGEGLPMVVQIIEEEHLGEFEITATPGQGCRAMARLPVKLNANREKS